jgi:hypothetical protein
VPELLTLSEPNGLPYGKQDFESIGKNDDSGVACKEISDRTVEIVSWLCVHFFQCLRPITQYKNFIRSGRQLLAEASMDDLAFLVVAMEQHGEVWKEMRSTMASENVSKLTKQQKDVIRKSKEKWNKNGLSGEEAQCRMAQVRYYFVRLIIKKEVENAATRINKKYKELAEASGEANRFCKAPSASNKKARKKEEQKVDEEKVEEYLLNFSSCDPIDLTDDCVAYQPV